MMKPPEGWPRISSAVVYAEPAKAIDWLCRAFGFQVRVKIEGEPGQIMHSELTYGDGVIMVGGGHKESRVSPRAIDGRGTQQLMVYVDDVEKHCATAREHGAKIVSPLSTTDYGDDWYTDRIYECEDLEGHRWWFTQRLAEAKTPRKE